MQRSPLRPMLALALSIAACKQIVSVDDLILEDGKGGAPTSSTQTTGPSTTSDGASHTSTSSTGLPSVCVDACREDFADTDLAPCMTDTDELELATETIADGRLQLIPQENTGFWNTGTNARLYFATVSPDMPFVAVTNVRLHAASNPNDVPTEDNNFAGLATRRTGQSVSTAVGWMKNEAGRFQGDTYGIRAAYRQLGEGGGGMADPLFQDDPVDRSDLYTGIQLGLCRYSSGGLHAFYKAKPTSAWTETRFTEDNPERIESGSLDIAILAAAFMSPGSAADFDGLVVRTCAGQVIDATSCPGELAAAAEGL